MTLELKMSLLRAVFECRDLPLKQRQKVARAYSKLHAQRPPETVKTMEEKAGLNYVR